MSEQVGAGIQMSASGLLLIPPGERGEGVGRGEGEGVGSKNLPMHCTPFVFCPLFALLSLSAVCFFLVANFPLFSPLRSELPYVYWNWRPFICVYTCGDVYVYLCVYCVYVNVKQEYKTVAKQSMATTLESGTVSVCILS